MPRTIDMIGFETGRAVVVKYAGSKDNRSMWECKCECGKNFTTSGKSLRNGFTSSCGCYRAARNARQGKNNGTHNETKTRLYGIWRGIKKRCYIQSDTSYKNYGAKGITMYKEWHESYESFRVWSLKNGYSDDLTIDRIDGKQGYYPDNCRWSDWVVQANNRSNNVRILFGGELLTKSEVAKKIGISSSLLHYRINNGIQIDAPKKKGIKEADLIN